MLAGFNWLAGKRWCFYQGDTYYSFQINCFSRWGTTIYPPKCPRRSKSLMILSIVPSNSYAREKSLEQFPLFWRDLPRALSKYLPGEKAIDLETVVFEMLCACFGFV